MRRFAIASLVAGLALSACVTINVYFPAAEVEEAAREFVDKVIGEEPRTAPPQSSTWRPTTLFAAALGFVIGDAQAQSADINIRTPAIQAIQQRMSQRFQSQLEPGFESGALGFGRDGLVVLRDPAKASLKDRATLQQAVADDNRDRNAVYREIAVANGHPEWESQIRETFARQWIERARAGWWYQDASGGWQQK
jgi:uncharacterized protein YdbL (DUF1318 family)